MQNEIIEFIKAAIRNPTEVSTIFPTSSYLANHLLDEIQLKPEDFVVELGVGTGAITQHLCKRPEFSPYNYLGIELDGPMTDFLRSHYQSLRFEKDYAQNLNKHLEGHKVDVVISSLPWTMFNNDIQQQTVEAIYQSLKPGGKFVAYMCINSAWYPQAKNFRKLLNERFLDVQHVGVEWRNLPPAFILKAIK